MLTSLTSGVGMYSKGVPSVPNECGAERGGRKGGPSCLAPLRTESGPRGMYCSIKTGAQGTEV